MFPHSRIIAAQLETVRVVLAILHRDIGVAALAAAQLDNDAVALLTCHGAFLIALFGGIAADLSICKLAVIVAANRQKDKRAQQYGTNNHRKMRKSTATRHIRSAFGGALTHSSLQKGIDEQIVSRKA